MKKFWNIFGDVLLVLIIVLALIGIVYGFSSKSQNGGVPTLFGKSAYTVPTDSMNISKDEAKNQGLNTKTLVHKGDLVFGDSSTSFEDLEVGDVIFFWYLSDDETKSIIVVHRIVGFGYSEATGAKYWICHGDNPNIPDTEQLQKVYAGAYIAKLSGKISGFGYIILFLTSNVWINYTKTDGTINQTLKNMYDMKLPIGFGIVIVLPIFIYLMVMIFRLVQTINNNKKVEAMEDIANNVQSDAVKDAIIQEYLKKQEEEKNKEKVAPKEPIEEKKEKE